MPRFEGLDFLSKDHAPALLAGAVGVFVFLGLWTSLRSLRREGLNRTAVSAILLFFLAAGIFAAAKSGSWFSWPDWPTGAALRLLSLVLGTGAGALGFIALGLHDRSRHRAGRLHAVAALLAGTAVASASAVELSRFIHTAAASTRPIALAPPDPAPVPVVPAPEPTKPPANPPVVLEDQRRGIRFTLPGPWKILRQGEASENPLFGRKWPEIQGTVVGERLVDDLEPLGYAELVLNQLRNAGELLDTDKRTATVGGREFIVLESRLRLPDVKTPFRYEHWIHLQGDCAWQIVLWSTGLSPARLRSEAESIMQGFGLLDRGPEEKVVARLPDDGHGWKAEFPSRWKMTTSSAPLYQVQLSRLSAEMMLASLPRPQASLPLDDLGAVFLRGFDFEENEETGKAAKPWNPGGEIRGLEWRLQKKLKDGRDFSYLFRVADGRHRTWLIMAAGEMGKNPPGFLDAHADAIQLVDDPPTGSNISPPAADFWNQIGLRRFKAGDFLTAAPVFRHAFLLSGNKDLVLLENAGHAMECNGEIKPALELLSAHGGSDENQIDVQLRLARLHVLDGNTAAGAKCFDACHNKIHERENDLLSWMRFLHTNGHTGDAIAAAETWLRKQPGQKNPRRWLAQSQMLAGLKDEGVAAFKALAEEFPEDQELTHELAENLNEAGNFQEALATLQPLVTANKATARTHTIIGWSHYGRKWFRDAKASFEQALKLSPGDAELEGHIRDAAAQLGQGNHSSILEALDPVPLPEELRARLARDKPPADFGIGHSAVWLQRLTSWDFRPGKPLRRTQRMKVLVQDAEGAENHSTITIPFDPLIEKVHLNRLDVFDDEGHKVGSARTEDAYIRDQVDGMATHDQVLHVPAPGVAPGCTVEWEVTIEGLAPVKSFPFERVLFANYLPTWIQAAHITGDNASIKAVTRQGEKIESLAYGEWKAWIAGPLPPAAFEAFSVWAEEEKPYLCLGGNEGSWKDVGLDYLSDLKDRLEAEPAVAKMARQLTQDCPDDAAKTAVLARHVQKSIAYKAIEFGTRARLPNTASETLRLNYGDCKDTSLLLHQMLSAVGTQSHLALVHNDWKTVEELPSLDQFNHMVVFVPSLGKDRFIDPTDKTLDTGRFPADGLWHTRALVLDPKIPRLVSPPASADSAACDIAIRRHVSPGEGKWKVNESVILTGYYASRMRSAFLGQNPEDQQRRLQAILSAQANARVERFVFHGLEDPRAETRLEMVYTVQAPMPIIGGSRHAALPALWEKDYLSTPFIRDRKSDFRISYPIRLVSETKLAAPPGLDESTLKALATRGESEFANWELTTGPSGENTEERNIRFRFHGAAGRFPATRYTDYHEAWEAARAAWEKTLSWPTGEAEPAP